MNPLQVQQRVVERLHLDDSSGVEAKAGHLMVLRSR
jgi:hypothetical protein